MNAYLTEAVGAFFLTLVIALSTGSVAPIAIGAILIAMVYMGGAISGGHYNPAVTIAVLVRGSIEKVVAMKYIVAQVLGAALAGLVYTQLTGSLFFPVPAADATTTNILLVEVLFTFALATTVITVGVSEKTKGNHYFGLAIGLVILAAAVAGGPISGGVYNPAVALGPALFRVQKIKEILPHLILYLVGPSVGGIIAGMVNRKSA